MSKVKKMIAMGLAVILTFVGAFTGKPSIVNASEVPTGNEQKIAVDFSNGIRVDDPSDTVKYKYTVDNVEVIVSLPGTVQWTGNVASLSETDEISLSDSFNSDKMQVKVYEDTENGFSVDLSVDQGKTKLANRATDGGWPNGTLKFKIDPIGEPPVGPGPGPSNFSGTVYLVWQGDNDALCIHKIEGLQPGATDDKTNYLNLADIKDDVTHEQFKMSAGNTVYWMWDNSKAEFLDVNNFDSYSEMNEELEKDENVKRKYAIDPCGFENSASRVGTYGDRTFRAVIIDETNYEAIAFSANPDDYTYFPSWWDPVFFTSTVDISGTTKDSPAVYEAFVLEPSIKFATGDRSVEEIVSVQALDVPNGAVTIEKNAWNWEISFANNFFDNVIFEIKTAAQTYYVKIVRVAIQAHDNFGPETPEEDERIICELYYDENKNAADYEVYATVFYDDGHKEMKKLGEPVSADKDGGEILLVAGYEIPYTQDMVGIAYNVLEAGALSGEGFSGAYIGSGEGTYYDIDARRIIY